MVDEHATFVPRVFSSLAGVKDQFAIVGRRKSRRDSNGKDEASEQEPGQFEHGPTPEDHKRNNGCSAQSNTPGVPNHPSLVAYGWGAICNKYACCHDMRQRARVRNFGANIDQKGD
jgi:hypothetical protein